VSFYFLAAKSTAPGGNSRSKIMNIFYCRYGAVKEKGGEADAPTLVIVATGAL
jgi:hypothetical protein